MCFEISPYLPTNYWMLVTVESEFHSFHNNLLLSIGGWRGIMKCSLFHYSCSKISIIPVQKISLFRYSRKTKISVILIPLFLFTPPMSTILLPIKKFYLQGTGTFVFGPTKTFTCVVVRHNNTETLLFSYLWPSRIYLQFVLSRLSWKHVNVLKHCVFPVNLSLACENSCLTSGELRPDSLGGSESARHEVAVSAG